MTTPTLNAVALGMTDLEVSPVPFAAWQLGGAWGRRDGRK